MKKLKLNFSFFGGELCPDLAIIATATQPYFKLRWLQMKLSLNNKENAEFVKKVVVNSLETLDQNDSPENSASQIWMSFMGFQRRTGPNLHQKCCCFPSLKTMITR